MTWISDLLRALTRPLIFWVVVAAWEQGVLVRFGKRSRALAPGIHLRIPVLDRVAVICVRERVVSTSCKTASTRDGHALSFELAIFYSIADALRLVSNVASPEGKLQAIALSCASEEVCKLDRSEVTPGRIADAVTAGLQSHSERWGLEGVVARVTTFAYARTVRLLVAQDSNYSSRFDCTLDDKPATIT